MVLLPMEEGEVDTEEVKRFKRSLDPSEITQINEISRRVLRSIEAVLIAEKDHGKCLHQVLCENNKYSKERNDGQKIWIPIWGLVNLLIKIVFEINLKLQIRSKLVIF